MKRFALALAALLLASLALAAFAGSGHGKAKKADYRCEEDITACLTKQMAAYKEKGWWGVKLDSDDYGNYVIAEVIAGSPAEAAGFAAGDRIVSMNGIAFSKDNKAALKEAKKSMTIGSKVAYVVYRAGAKQKLSVTLGEVPTDVMAAWIGYHMMEHHAPTQVASS